MTGFALAAAVGVGGTGVFLFMAAVALDLVTDVLSLPFKWVRRSARLQKLLETAGLLMILLAGAGGIAWVTAVGVLGLLKQGGF